MSPNSLVIHTSGGYFIKPCCFSIFDFSLYWVEFFMRFSLMSNCLLIILVIGSCVAFGSFPSKFLKCCFHSCIRFSWLVAFSLALAVLFLLLTSFTVCHAILDCLSSSESLILLIYLTHRWLTLFLNEAELICLHTTKRFQVLLFNTNNFIIY